MVILWIKDIWAWAVIIKCSEDKDYFDIVSCIYEYTYKLYTQIINNTIYFYLFYYFIFIFTIFWGFLILEDLHILMPY